jgi:hypothetical protein
MTLREAEKLLEQRWMTLTVEERLRTCAGLYSTEKAILERLAPEHYSRQELIEFVFYHMHGMTIEESINLVREGPQR